MTRVVLCGTLVAFACLSSPARAQWTSDDLLACGADAVKFCSKTIAGGGKPFDVRHCLIYNTKKISVECRAALRRPFNERGGQ